MLRLRVKEIAQEKKLSMNMLSHRSEVAYNIIKDCYRNPYRVINSETINKIAKGLGVSATDILENVSEEFAAKEMEERNIKR
jgi:DNA-binding Xre family transcriptional regulator